MPVVDGANSASSGQSPTLRIVAWNVQSGDTDPEVISDQLAEFKDCDIVALSEVALSDQYRYFEALRAAEPRVGGIYGGTGRDERLMIVFRQDKLQLLVATEPLQFHQYGLNDEKHGSPLVAQFRCRQTATVFSLISVHFARSSATTRENQARGLRDWALESPAAIAIGDFNFDYDFPTRRGNAAFVEFVANGTWKWAKPESWIDTNWADHDGDGRDDYPNSMLDFAFLAGAARQWPHACRVLVRDGDFPDDARTSDHRPIELLLTIPTSQHAEAQPQVEPGAASTARLPGGF